MRNPWDRVISECFCPHIQLIFKGCRGIEDKIKKVCSLSEKGYANHCKKQVAFITAPDLKLDFIGRFERLEEDFVKVCNEVGRNYQKLLRTNQSQHRNYRKYYNDEMRELVAEKYTQDIEYFGYEFGK